MYAEYLESLNFQNLGSYNNKDFFYRYVNKEGLQIHVWSDLHYGTVLKKRKFIKIAEGIEEVKKMIEEFIDKCPIL